MKRALKGYEKSAKIAGITTKKALKATFSLVL